MGERIIPTCDRHHGDALRTVEVDGQQLCPRCALAVIDEAMRQGDVITIDVQRREQPGSKVTRMRGRG